MKVDRDKLPHVRWLRKQEERRRFAELLEVQSNRPWVATPRPESASSWGLSEHQQRYRDRRARGEEERPSLFERFAAKPFETLEPPKTDGVTPAPWRGYDLESFSWRLLEQKIETEIASDRDWLKKLLGEYPNWVSLPKPRQDVFNDFMGKEGFPLFSMEHEPDSTALAHAIGMRRLKKIQSELEATRNLLSPLFSGLYPAPAPATQARAAGSPDSLGSA